MSGLRSVVIAALITLLAAGAIAWVLLRPSGTAIVDLEVGDCFDLPEIGDDAGEVSTIDAVDVVPCSEPHRVEVVATGLLNPDQDRPYPDDPELFRLVDEQCVIDVPLEFGIVPMAPGPASWDAMGGPYQCLAIALGDVTTTGSITAP